MSHYKKIVIAIDLNTEYENVIKRALTITEAKEDLSLLYVTMSSVYIQPYLYGVHVDGIQNDGLQNDYFNDAERMKEDKKRLQAIAEKFGISSDNVHVKLGNAAEEIQDFANESHADLIVMGTHGRSGIKLLLGSTANSVLHGVKQDVLAVRMHDHLK